MATGESLTHRVRPGIKPLSSWILVGFVTPEPQWELLDSVFFTFLLNFQRTQEMKVFIYLSFFFLGPHPRHMEVSRLAVKSEPQLLAYTAATATSDPSRVCHLHHSSQQCRILNPLSKARDRTRNLMDARRIHFHHATTAAPHAYVFREHVIYSFLLTFYLVIFKMNF